MGHGWEQRRRTGILSVAILGGVVSVLIDHLPRDASDTVGSVHRRMQGEV
jgi:hypothetical protein